MVKQEIFNMKVNKSCGPDEVPSRILKELVDSLSAPVYHLTGSGLTSRRFSKKGLKSHTENYRPSV